MKRRHLGWSYMFAGVLASTACESSMQVGSACPSGQCPALAAIEGRACLMSDLTVALAPSDPPDPLCLPRRLPLDDAGLAACTMEWELADRSDPFQPDAPLHCGDVPFLQRGVSEESAGETCIVPQLSAEEYASGEAQGWFYERDPSAECRAAGAIRFTDEARPPDNIVQAVYHCSVVLAEDEDGVHNVDPNECAGLPGSSSAEGVGESCMPIVPDGGFDDRRAYVQTGASECLTGACLVFRLDGDPASDCVPSADVACATPDQVEQRVLCSCRCDAPDGSAPECDCPDGFTCVDMFQRGPEEVRGSYCMRNLALGGGT